MRLLMLSVLLIGSAALADVGPKPPHCSVPTECRTCLILFGEPDAGHECWDEAVDAGLKKSECADTVGPSRSDYYCPAGKDATRPCGCSTVEGFASVGALLFLAARRGRRVDPRA